MTTLREAIIYLRLSDFRDDDADTFDAREAELRQLAADLGLTVVRVAVENDLNGNGKTRGASAYKTPKRVTISTGQVEFRTNRPVFQGVVLDLQRGVAQVLIVGDDSRITRNHRDGLDLLDACKVSGASAVAPDDEGMPRWILTNGGTRAEVSAFLDRVNDARKYSDDIGAKVRKGRARWAGKSYQGGRRPFGYRVAEGTDEHARNLVIDETEAAALRAAAADLLKGVSLKAVIRDLRAKGVVTVTGADWSTRTLRDALVKPSVIGKTLRRGQLVDAPWSPILDEPTWESLRTLFADPARRTNTGRGHEPRWLVSIFAKCGVCGKRMTVGGAGKGRSPAYVGRECGHLRRSARLVDAYISDLVVARLEQDDAADLLRPAPRPGIDRKALTADLGVIRDRRAALARQFAAGVLDESDLAAGAEVLRGRESVIVAQLASTDETDQLEEFRGNPARVVWDALPMARRRAVVQLLIESVVIDRSPVRGNQFDDRSVVVTWKGQTAEVAA